MQMQLRKTKTNNKTMNNTKYKLNHKKTKSYPPSSKSSISMISNCGTVLTYPDVHCRRSI